MNQHLIPHSQSSIQSCQQVFQFWCMTLPLLFHKLTSYVSGAHLKTASGVYIPLKNAPRVRVV